jgi:hypothetical protein
LSKLPRSTAQEGISEVRLLHTGRATGAVFDEPNLVSCAGLVPMMTLAEKVDLVDLAGMVASVDSTWTSAMISPVLTAAAPVGQPENPPDHPAIRPAGRMPPNWAPFLKVTYAVIGMTGRR